MAVGSVVRGTVMWFDGDKGYGLIAVDGGSEVFVHYSAIDMPGFKVLEPNARVEVELPRGGRRRRADAVRPVSG